MPFLFFNSRKTMKRSIFLMALILNLSIILLCLTYPVPNLNMFPWLMAVSHVLLFILNLKAGSSWLRLILLSSIHVIATYLTHQLYTMLYFTRILGSLDGRKWAMGLCVLDTAWTVILFIVAMVIFRIRTKRSAKRSI